MPPTRVGHIRIEKVLGQGGMGTVYVGFDEKLERRVALKAIRAERRMSPAIKERFQREARVLSKIEHPNICRIHDYIEEDGAEYLVLEFVEGHTLAAHLESRTLEAHHRLTIAIQIADALVAAHTAGVVHRDLKPDNVLITRSGDAKVLDFGLARSVDVESGEPSGHANDATANDAAADSAAADSAAAGASAATERASSGTRPPPDTPAPIETLRTPTNDLQVTEAGVIMGTPLYMSPEQARGLSDEISTASDMYSFGLLLQTMWTNTAPYPPGLSRAELLRRAREGQALEPSDMPKPILQLVRRLRALDPQARSAAIQARHHLRRFEARPVRWLRQGAAVLLVLIAIGAAVKYTVDLRHERGLAQDAAREQTRLRGVADTRRDLAEDLIGFMLDDLFTKLRGAGKLELLDDVDRQALEYFSALPESELSTEELSRRAQTLYQIGEVSIERGDLPTALEAFDESLRLQQAVVAEEPDNQSALHKLGYAHFWMGTGHWNEGDLDEARAQFEASAEVAQRLVDLDPQNPDYILELAAEVSNVAQVLEAQGDLAEAAEVMTSRLDIVKSLVASDAERADWQLELANSHLLLGRVLEAQDKPRDAEAHYRADLELMLEIVGRDPEHAEHLDRLGTSYSYLGHIVDDVAQAALYFEEQQAVAARLASGDTENAGWRDHVAAGLLNLGKLRLENGQLDEARGPLMRATEIYVTLSRQDPTRERWRTEALAGSAAYATLLEALDAPDEAFAVAQEGLSLLGELSLDELGTNARSEAERLAAIAPTTSN